MRLQVTLLAQPGDGHLPEIGGRCGHDSSLLHPDCAAHGTAPGTAEGPLRAADRPHPHPRRRIGRRVDGQDLWRAAGLHVAPAKDANGANRTPVIDANWIVVSQDPKDSDD
ncbi:hypothetical protein Sya03_59000 [Spirilliplanes yamanashiensis]|uniref:Uncharacterized protein n=1 Tax=Spirilliplanes yamanashiensis TaxID=42233 RepID=A0A8J3YF65_9ACTN|nr:hypothetical protein Sya03_59000 [Spirilliplanes yamanashiensis]